MLKIIIPLIFITTAAFIIFILTSNSEVKQIAPCETFIPDGRMGPGHQCRNDPRSKLVVYPNGNALCVCNENDSNQPN